MQWEWPFLSSFNRISQTVSYTVALLQLHIKHVLIVVCLLICIHVYQLFLINQKGQCYLHRCEAVAHPSGLNVRSGEFFAELHLSEKITDLTLCSDIHIQHNNLITVQSKFVLLDIDTLPKLSDLLLDRLTDLAKNCQLLKWRLYILIQIIQLIDRLSVRDRRCWCSLPDILQS